MYAKPLVRGNSVYVATEDTDLGSVAPTVLPNGDLFQIGKGGAGYIVSGADLGGIGGQIASTSVGEGAYGATTHVGQSIFVSCLDGIFDVAAPATNLSVAWQTGNFDAGFPIATGNIIWAVDINEPALLGFNISTGAQVYSFALGGTEHLISPAAGTGAVYVAGGSQPYAFALVM